MWRTFGGKIVIVMGLIWGQMPFAPAQSSYQLLREIDKPFESIAIDELGHIYASDGTVLYKYDSKGELLFTYSDLSAGRITSFDVSNPMKVLVFFKDFATIAFLDNKLTLQQRSFLNAELGLYDPLCVCLSYDNGFWVYDRNLDRLCRYNSSGKLQSSGQHIAYISNVDVIPIGMYEVAGAYLLLHDSLNGLFIFDHFGTYIKTIPLQATAISLRKTVVFYVQDTYLRSINIETLEEKESILPRPDISFIIYRQKTIVALTQTKTLLIFTELTMDN